MTAVLSHLRVDGGERFQVKSHGSPVPIDRWALEGSLRSETGKPARLSALLQLIADDAATEINGDTVDVRDVILSGLDGRTLQSFGLPPSSDATLQLQTDVPLTDPDFRVRYQFIHPNGRPVVSYGRDGCFLTIGEQVRTLPESLYSLLEAVDSFNEAVPQELEARFIAWSQVSERLPEGVLVDDRLSSIRISVASSFTLDLTVDTRGVPDFDPAVGRVRSELSELDAGSAKFETAVPEERQKEFVKRFRGLNSVKRRYSAGAGWFVILAPRVQRALEVVKRMQSASPEMRRDFVRNPKTFLREALDPERQDASFEDLFHDEGYSERVKGIGLWEAKVLPWVSKPSEPWLPPEELGLRIGDKLVRVQANELPDLLSRVVSARQAGEGSVSYRGEPVPANDDAEEALRALVGQLEPEPPEREANQAEGAAVEGAGNDAVQSSGKLALLVIDNLGQVEYEPRAEAERGRPGRLPSVLRSELLPHQKDGLIWLQSHWARCHPGVLLADDMGLGKTLESLAFLAWLQEEQEAAGLRRPLLVVAPTGLLKNWQDEHDKHLDDAGLGRLLLAYGSGLKNLRTSEGGRPQELRTGLPVLNVRELENADWVMTTYETLRDYQHSFARVRWGAVVFDEAQKIKNPAAAVTDAAKAMNAEFLISLTGTPVENRLADLWCIVDTVQPGRLGSLKEFSSRYEAVSPEDAETTLRGLRDLLAGGDSPQVMLRRLKEDHLPGLPEKQVVLSPAVMPPRQAAAYEEQVLSGRAGAHPLETLHGLRSISLHPYQRESESDEEYISDSARLTGAFEVLDEVANRQEKALVFVESREMQGYLTEIIQRRYKTPEPPLVINGAVSGDKRKARVDVFQERRGFDVMLLSPKAGGVGLTLTAANHVIHLSRWWNPAVEDQCTDRVFRIGQRKTVSVHVPIARHPDFGDHSFDLVLDRLLTKKRALNRSVLAPTGASEDDIHSLFSETLGETATGM